MKTGKPPNKHICSTCHESFEFKSFLLRHIKSKHSEKQVQFSLPVAPKEDDFEKILGSEKKESEKPFSCHICDLTFSLRAKLKTHLEKEHDFQH